MYNDFETFSEFEVTFIEKYWDGEELKTNEGTVTFTMKYEDFDEIRRLLLNSDELLSNQDNDFEYEDVEIIDIKHIY